MSILESLIRSTIRALDRGDPSTLELILDDATRAKTAAPDGYDLIDGGAHIPVFNLDLLTPISMIAGLCGLAPPSEGAE